VYLEPIRKQRAPGDDPSIGMRLGMLAALVIILFSILGFRLWFLQVLSGDSYIQLADNNRLRTVTVEAPRGVVYDRNGVPLVENRAGLSVGVLPMDLRGEDTVLPRLAKLLEMSEDEVRAKVEAGRRNPYIVTVLKEDVSESPVVDYLLERRLEFPGVRVEKRYVREYPYRARATHLLGHVGEISQEELELEKFRTLRPAARVGKDGVESIYDNFLRGVDGERSIEVDAAGRPKRELQVRQPLPGKNLVLTIDHVIQEASERALAAGLERAHANGFKDAAAGAVVALNPKNGEVLAMTSYPDYDPSLWVGGMKQEDWDRLTAKEAHDPLFNRATNGRYPAASTFKPFVALTALKTGLVSPDFSVFDPGYYKIGQQRWKCWDEDGHGTVDLVESLMVSCDTYFYTLGEKFYHQPAPVLQQGLREFGFGRATGIDLPGEKEGRVPDKDWKKKAGKTNEDKLWKPGDDVNLSIGQGDLLVTPLQLAVAFAALANSHTDENTGRTVLDLLVPRLALQITDAAGNAEKQFETERRSQITVTAQDLELVRKGLRYVTSQRQGTAYAAFKGFPESIPVVGKTGTAEKIPDDDYAWFMAYAPADDPQIVVVALVEQGGHGSSVAAPVVRQVLEAYFDLEPSAPIEVQVTE
jgi:penicillin-binding protein 2